MVWYGTPSEILLRHLYEDSLPHIGIFNQSELPQCRSSAEADSMKTLSDTMKPVADVLLGGGGGCDSA